MAVCKVTSNKKSGQDTVYDPRMGTTSGDNCETCSGDAFKCQGHFGYIELNEHIIHPLFYKRVVDILNCFCLKCYRLLLTEEQLNLYGLNKFKNQSRFVKILDKLKKVDICCNQDCCFDKPKIRYTPNDDNIIMIYVDRKKNKSVVTMTTNEIKQIFDNISDDDVRLIGFDPTLIHPRNLIISNLPVLPPCDRPYVKADGNICDDDLTMQYIEIIKVNNHLADKTLSESKKQKHISTLKFRIKTMFNNSKQQAKLTQNGRPVKGIKERLTGKDGLIRDNLLGKRCFSPDTNVLLWNANIKKIGELKVGSFLIGKDGTKHIVEHIISGFDDMYEVTQGENGMSYKVTIDHVLSLKHISSNEYINIPLSKYMKHLDYYQENYKGYKTKHPIKWNSSKHTLDDDIMYKFGRKLAKEMSVYNPYIPKTSSIKNRLHFLAGIIDYIGIVDYNCIRIPCNTNVINDLQFLCRSLGFTANKIMTVLYITGENIKHIPLKIRVVYSHSLENEYTTLSVRKIGYGKFIGIKILGTSSEFLLEDFTVVHNCDYTARTVIGPDPTLKMGQLAVPYEMSNVLTVPVHVTEFNIKELQKKMERDEILYIRKNGGRFNLKYYKNGTNLMYGDIIVRNGVHIKVDSNKYKLIKGDSLIRNSELVTKIQYSGRVYPISVGDIVERKLTDGDIVLLNRQPTLHKASMLAMEVVLRNDSDRYKNMCMNTVPSTSIKKNSGCKTFRFNLAITKGYNADFDGDEMNVHVPQSIEAQTELKYISAVKWNMISPQSSKPNVAIVQDSLLGAYLMTVGNKTMTKTDFFNLANVMDMSPSFVLDKIKHISLVLKKLGKKTSVFTGKNVFSLMLPKDLIYDKKNNTDPLEPVIKIYKGVLYEGALDKTIIGASNNSLIQIMYKEYGPEETSIFIDRIQFATNNWLLKVGFSIGLGDCVITNEKKKQEINDVIEKCYIEVDGIKNMTSHVGIREVRINATLNKAKDIGLRIAKKSLSADNNFLPTITSGSKGDFFNIAQITGLLGQQNLQGKRIPLSLNHGKRSLPHYPLDKLDSAQEYESRGFIASSFIHGLNPRQFYFHAMSGREGVSDTAMGTATSGYMQRSISKLTDDIKIEYDQTVRDVTGRIYQNSYGEFGIDPSCAVKISNELQICDVSRLVNRLNMKYEDSQ
jgi:DNA-directed RNA polymerase beta' subunit